MKKEKKLEHIGIIMDGNRRFAKKLMLNPSKGHEWGAKKVRKLFDWCKELGIRQVTLYTLSLENFNRPKKEFDYLMNIFRKEFKMLTDDDILKKEGIRLNFIGRTNMLPADIQKLIKELQKLTKDNKNFIVNFARAYGGRGEIVDAAKKIAQDAKDGKIVPDNLNEESFKSYLYMPDDPDLVIRTGGDNRTSNFLNYQIAYSELFFIDKMWPEFEKEDLKEVISSYYNRERRFGR